MKLNPKVMLLASFSTLIPVIVYLFDVLPYKYLGPGCLLVFVIICIIQWGSYNNPNMALFIEEDEEAKLIREKQELQEELNKERKLANSYKQQASDMLYELDKLRSEPLGELLKRRVAKRPPPPPEPPRTCVGAHKFNRQGMCTVCGTKHTGKGSVYCAKHGHKYNEHGVCERCGQYDYFIRPPF